MAFWDQVWQQFAQTSWLEWLGTVSGFLCVYLAARQNIWNWPIAIISVLAYSVLFYQYKLYGDAALQFYFLGTSVYGWYYWLKRKQENQKPVVSLHARQQALVLGLTLFAAGLLGLFLDRVTDTDVPYIDGLCTAISFAAQLMMTRKILQNWIWWIVVDIIYIPLYIHKDLYLTALLYAFFLLLALMGYRDWRRSWKTATSNA